MEPSKEQIEQWHSDPKNWKWGGIYYNPEDPRGVVDKRVKWMGITVNFANKKAVKGLFLAMVGLFVIAGLVVYMAEKN